VDDIGGLAFWLRPDWSGGDNLRDPGTEPFWMLPPLTARRPLSEVRPVIYGRHPVRVALRDDAQLVIGPPRAVDPW